MDEAEKVAYGALGLKPWEFMKYTVPEYLKAKEGYYEEKERLYRILLVGFRQNAFMHGKSTKARTPAAFWPLPWDEEAIEKKTKKQIKEEQEILQSEKWVKGQGKPLDRFFKGL